MDAILNLKRPNAGEGDEDLLKLQDHFLKELATPSVKVVKIKVNNDGKSSTNEKPLNSSGSNSTDGETLHFYSCDMPEDNLN